MVGAYMPKYAFLFFLLLSTVPHKRFFGMSSCRISHVLGVSLNYIEEKLAKQGTSKTQHDDQVSYATSKQIIQTKSRKIWHDRWARCNT